MTLTRVIGADAATIQWWQMVVRAIIVFCYTLALLRLSGQRIFSKSRSVDLVVAILLGSTLSRALTANARFLPTLAAVAALIGLHALANWLAARSRVLAAWLERPTVRLIAGGRVDTAALRANGVSDADLLEALRVRGGVDDPREVEAAFLERNGRISVVRRPAEMRPVGCSAEQRTPDAADDDDRQRGSPVRESNVL